MNACKNIPFHYLFTNNSVADPDPFLRVLGSGSVSYFKENQKINCKANI
jgi:hypothetical protein